MTREECIELALQGSGELEHRGSSPNIYSTFARTSIAWSFGNIENKGAF